MRITDLHTQACTHYSHTHTHAHRHFLSLCLTLQQPGCRGRALKAWSLTGPEESPGPVGQGHPEGQQLLLSPPVLPFFLLPLPPHLLFFLLMPCLSWTTLEPLPHFDQGNSGISVQAGRLCEGTRDDAKSEEEQQLSCCCQGFPLILDGDES